MLQTVAALVAEPISVFELGIACEVFGTDRSDKGLPRLTFLTCGPTAGTTLRTKSGFSITTDASWADAPGADLVIVPAAPSANADDYAPDYLRALRDSYERGATLMSFCSGTFPLAAAGLLDGRTATTHWVYLDQLRASYPHINIVEDVLYTHDERIITSAGTAAGIDASLYFLRDKLGVDVARAVARRMVVPPHRQGGQKQFVEAPMPEVEADTLRPTLDWVVETMDQPHTVASMARKAQLSSRTFARRFAAATGTTPIQWLIGQRILRAQELLAEGDLSMEDVAMATGFGSAAVLRHHFRNATGVTPTSYRDSFCCK